MSSRLLLGLVVRAEFKPTPAKKGAGKCSFLTEHIAASHKSVGKTFTERNIKPRQLYKDCQQDHKCVLACESTGTLIEYWSFSSTHRSRPKARARLRAESRAAHRLALRSLPPVGRCTQTHVMTICLGSDLQCDGFLSIDASGVL